MKKIKNRHRVLLCSEDRGVANDMLMLLSSHGYLVDTAESYKDISEKYVNYKHSILIADIDLLPTSPDKIDFLFRKARKRPVFLLINRDEKDSRLTSYLEYEVDDLLTLPIDADKLYRKVKRAAEYNNMQHDIEYHSGMLFMLKLLVPILMVLVFILTTGF